MQRTGFARPLIAKPLAALIMRKLLIPDRLKVEFATIESLWSSSAQT